MNDARVLHKIEPAVSGSLAEEPAVSHHLKVLVDAGLLTRDKRGVWVWFSIAPDRLDAIRSLLP